jgi:hypothetical protein
MKYLGTITDNKDSVTKEYVDNAAAGGGGITVDDLIGMLSQGGNITIEKVNGKVKISGTDKDTVTRVKGSAESSYRTGDVNLTAANIGAASSEHTHDDRYYTEAEVNDLLTVDALKEKLGLNPVSLSLKRDTSNTPADSTYTCTYIPALSRCFFRGYLAARSSKEFTSGNSYTLWTAPDSYKPATRHALAITNASSTRVDAWIKDNGTIQITPRGGAINKTNLIYITGWWGV